VGVGLVKARRRVVTSADRPATRPKRTPTVRRIKSAIVPAGAGSPPGARVNATTSQAQPSVSGPDGRILNRDRGVDLSVDLAPSRGGFVLANPILVASGTFGYGIEYGDVVDVDRLGAICCKGTTLKPRVGNVPPRVTETPAGMLNSIGLQNPGVDAVIQKYAPLWQRWQTPVIVNVAGESIADYAEVVRRLDGVPGVAAIELNISCPNVGKGGLQFAIDPDAAGAVTAAVRRVTELPLLVKLSPNVADVRPIARAIAVAADRRKPLLGNVFGGVSGPAIKPIALRVVYEVCQVVDIPVVAIGGITELADVLDFLAVGAVAVQVGTAVFADPTLPVRLVGELAAAAAAAGHDSYGPFIGAALPRHPGAPSAKGVEYRP
jgi:dihydroorotate dehydrogenase (NAD+) catalytic subunit